MTLPISESVASRFSLGERAEPFRLRSEPPHVHGYAWRHPIPSATILFLHGVMSHSHWFAESADLLLDRGISVYALDRRGSGSSPYEPGHICDYRDRRSADARRRIGVDRDADPGSVRSPRL